MARKPHGIGWRNKLGLTKGVRDEEPQSGREADLLAGIGPRLDAIEVRLAETQAMAARSYEAVLDWPALVAQMRGEPSYEESFVNEPLVSVRVATYNAAEVLCDRALSSLLRQDYDRWECIVVGDCCTDGTPERIKALGDSRIRFVNLPFRGPYPSSAKDRWYVAGGPPANRGLREAKGEWIAPLDHDDEWDDDHISALLAHALTTHAEVAYGQIRTIDVASGSESIMGAWPPTRGEFGFLGAVHHGGLARFHYDLNCRFADEPGDWNLARRLWEAGVTFSYLDRPVATHHHVPKLTTLSAEGRMIEELRAWAAQLEEGKEYWINRAEAAETRLRKLGASLEPDGD